ncbi:putative glucosylceramidase 2 [Mya arenaria]|uniref:putative glucosylceramidase 2 n=1 Tax=Mya arenaria TaxID=6604 RepID=UPI0022E6546B|nr:putative glucosylceramidase 2 [Mya arenaria]
MDLLLITTALFFFSLCNTSVLGRSDKPCQKTSFGGSTFVCMCNATYCDDVEPDVKLPDGVFAVYSTDIAADRLTKTTHKFYVLDENTSLKHLQPESDVFYIVTSFKPKQTVTGFGGTFTDASGMNIVKLPEGAQDNLIESYFGPSGIEYSLGRIPIASNDMSTDIYSYDFTNGDTGLSKFTISGYDHLYKIPFIDKAVVARGGNLSLFGSPWSSPDWMKTNDNMVGYGTILPEMTKVYANYLARFLSEYEGFMSHGRMWGLTTQSGPTRSCSNTSRPEYQSVCWTPETMRDWVVKDLKRSLQDSGYGYIKLFTMDDNADVMTEWQDTFDDVIALEAIDGFGIHGYRNNKTTLKSMCDTYERFPDKILLGTEYCQRGKPQLGAWELAEDFAEHIFDNLNNCGSGFIHYNLAVDMHGGPSWVNYNADAPIVVDSDGGNKVFYKQPTFYMMGHFSKFIPPGSAAIEMFPYQPNPEGVHAVGFTRPDNSTVLVISNFNTAESKTVGILYGKYYANYTMAPNSIHTLTWWKPGAVPGT